MSQAALLQDRAFWAWAARALFGLPPAESGQNLTGASGCDRPAGRHEVHHFCKRVEPKLIERVAWELWPMPTGSPLARRH